MDYIYYGIDKCGNQLKNIIKYSHFTKTIQRKNIKYKSKVAKKIYSITNNKTKKTSLGKTYNSEGKLTEFIIIKILLKDL